MKTHNLYNYLFLFSIVIFALFGGVLTGSRNYSYSLNEGMAFRHVFGSLHEQDEG